MATKKKPSSQVPKAAKSRSALDRALSLPKGSVNKAAAKLEKQPEKAPAAAQGACPDCGAPPLPPAPAPRGRCR